MAKNKGFEPDEEDLEDEDDLESDEEPEEEDEEVEPIKPKKKEIPQTKQPKLRIGTVQLRYQAVGYQVFKGFDEKTNEEIWIPCDKLVEAETYSELLKIANN